MLRRSLRRGFTVIEILVTLGILAVLGAILIPALRPRVDHAHASALMDSMSQISQGVQAYKEDVGWYPRSLIQLQSRPPTGLAPVTTICGVSLSSAHFVATWKGPYLAQRIESFGVQVGNSTISANLAYDQLEAPAGGGLGQIVVNVSNVDQSVWEVIDRSFDTQLSQNDGAIQWTEQVPGSQSGTLSYYIRIRGC